MAIASARQRIDGSVQRRQQTRLGHGASVRRGAGSQVCLAVQTSFGPHAGLQTARHFPKAHAKPAEHACSHFVFLSGGLP
jgi:hypothetical protein